MSIVVVVELVVRNSSSRSPGAHRCGIVTEWLGRFPAVVAESTYVMSPDAFGSQGSISLVTLPIAPSASVTVSVTSRLPPFAYVWAGGSILVPAAPSPKSHS